MADRIDAFIGEDMREQVIDVVIDALQHQGFPTMSRRSVLDEAAHRAAFLDMLEDCRPMPVIVALKSDLRAGRL